MRAEYPEYTKNKGIVKSFWGNLGFDSPIKMLITTGFALIVLLMFYIVLSATVFFGNCLNYGCIDKTVYKTFQVSYVTNTVTNTITYDVEGINRKGQTAVVIFPNLHDPKIHEFFGPSTSNAQIVPNITMKNNILTIVASSSQTRYLIDSNGWHSIDDSGTITGNEP